MQRNQWPLRYSAAQVRAAALAKEASLREQALDLKHQAAQVLKDPSEYCQSCGQPKHDDQQPLRRRSADPLASARAVEAKAEEYAKWAQALATRAEETLALHFDDAEFFGLLVQDAQELGLTGEPKGQKQLSARTRLSGLGERP